LALNCSALSVASENTFWLIPPLLFRSSVASTLLLKDLKALGVMGGAVLGRIHANGGLGGVLHALKSDFEGGVLDESFREDIFVLAEERTRLVGGEVLLHVHRS